MRVTSTAHTALRKYLLLGALCAGVEKDAGTCEVLLTQKAFT